jgi:surfactin synthase thioesterase subunit
MNYNAPLPLAPVAGLGAALGVFVGFVVAISAVYEHARSAMRTFQSRTAPRRGHVQRTRDRSERELLHEDKRVWVIQTTSVHPLRIRSVPPPNVVL